MSALALMALVGLTVFLPVFIDDADDTDDTEEVEEVDSTDTPADPADPDDPLGPAVDRDEIDGSGDADTLTAQSGETVAGLGGADVMTTAPGSEGAIIDGGDGDDTLELFGSSATARGGAGDDTIASFDVLDAEVDGGAGNDSIVFQPLTPGTNQSAAGSVDGGVGNDTITAFGIGGEVFGGEGDDLIQGQGSLLRLDGGAGDDTIGADSADYGGGTPVFGGDGNDLISLTNSPGFQVGSTADGGAGDDVIQTQTFLDSGTSFDTLTGGSGADRYELSFLGGAPTGDPVDAGIVTTITDFLPGTDILFVDTQLDPLADGTAPTLASVTLSEEPDGSFTDLVFTTGTDEGSAPLTGTIRLLGTTGMTLDDLAFREGSEISPIS